MRSLIILEVEHGEDTDDLNMVAMLAGDLDQVVEAEGPLEIVNYTVRVDLPDHFVLESAIPVHYI